MALKFLCGRDAAERVVSWDYGRPGAFREMLDDFELLVAARKGAFRAPAELREGIHTLAVPPEYEEISATDVRVRKEVAVLVRRLEALGIEVLGFGLSPNRYSWAIRIAHNENALPNALVWDVWFSDVCGLKLSPPNSELKTALAEYKRVA